MKKKIIIFTCTGGHIPASQALKEYLCDAYEVQVINMFSDVLLPIDLINKITIGKKDSQDLYNWVLRNRWYKFANKWFLTGYNYYLFRSKKVFELIDAALEIHNPDMIISVIPLFNQFILAAAQKRSIPFLIIPTDVDVTTFFYGIKKPDYEQFHVGLMIDNKFTRETINPVEISESNIHVVGPVLRSGFIQKKNIPALKQEFGIKNNVPVLLLAMGSQGSVSTYDFCAEVSKYYSKPLHLLVVSGRNQKGNKKLRVLPNPYHIGISLFDFTDRMDDLMAMADLFITKSGGMSLMEGLSLQVPMILDATSESLIWERSNQKLVCSLKKGVLLNQTKDLPGMVQQMLLQNNLKDELPAFGADQAGIKIKELVQRLI